MIDYIPWLYNVFISFKKTLNTPCHDISFCRSGSAKYTVFEHAHFHNLFWEVNIFIVENGSSLCSNWILDLANRWRKDWCKVHNCLNSNPPCNCEPPFQLFNFPTVKKHSELRLLWCKLFNRDPSDQEQLQSTKFMDPRSKSRICSSHFVDRKPTAENSPS